MVMQQLGSGRSGPATKPRPQNPWAYGCMGVDGCGWCNPWPPYSIQWLCRNSWGFWSSTWLVLGGLFSMTSERNRPHKLIHQFWFVKKRGTVHPTAHPSISWLFKHTGPTSGSSGSPGTRGHQQAGQGLSNQWTPKNDELRRFPTYHIRIMYIYI